MSSFFKTFAVAGPLATTATLTWASVSMEARDHAPSVPAPGQSPTHQRIALYVRPRPMGSTGPDDQHRDTAPGDFVLRWGAPVTLTVINYDECRHTIFAPDLNLNLTIEAGVRTKNGGWAEDAEKIVPTTTVHSFTPDERGEFRWQCVVVCDEPTPCFMSDDCDGSGRDGFMAGWIKVL